MAGRSGPWSKISLLRSRYDGVCLTTVRRAEGVAKREELAVKRPVPPRFRLLTEGPPLLPAGLNGNTVVVNHLIYNTLAQETGMFFAPVFCANHLIISG